MIGKKLKNIIRQLRCKHKWHFLTSQYEGIMVKGTDDRIAKAECVFCGKVIKNEKKLFKLMQKEGL